MAWISVHEETMKREALRIASILNCSQNEAIGIILRLLLWADNNTAVSKDDLTAALSVGRRKRLRANDIVDALIACGWIDAELRVTDLNKNTGTNVRVKKSYSNAFSEFWAAYPRKEGKGMAYREYSARQQEGYTSEELLTAAKNYAIMCASEHREMKYIKLAKTFLGESAPFLDYVDAASGKGKSSRTSEDDFEGLPSS